MQSSRQLNHAIIQNLNSPEVSNRPVSIISIPSCLLLACLKVNNNVVDLRGISICPRDPA